MPSFESRLAAGSRKTTGCADEVATEVRTNHELLPDLLASCDSPEPLIQMRAFDALEKALRGNPVLDTLETRAAIIAGLQHPWWEVRIQCIRAIGLCTWPDPKQVAVSVAPILQDDAKFVRAWAIDTAVQLAHQDHSLIPWAEEAIQMGLGSGFASIVKRAQKSTKDLPS